MLAEMATQRIAIDRLKHADSPSPAFAALPSDVFEMVEKLTKLLFEPQKSLSGQPLRLDLVSWDKEGPRHVAMNWARRLKRVFGIEIEGCARCGGKLEIIASIEEPEVIAKILSHLDRMAPQQYQGELPLGARAPPSVQSRLI